MGAGAHSSVVGGQNNEATGAWATVIGGSTNVASGEYSLCAGLESTASGDYSVAIGRSASTNNKDGAMVLGDSNTGDIYASEHNGPPPPPAVSHSNVWILPRNLLHLVCLWLLPSRIGRVVRRILLAVLRWLQAVHQLGRQCRRTPGLRLRLLVRQNSLHLMVAWSLFPCWSIGEESGFVGAGRRCLT